MRQVVRKIIKKSPLYHPLRDYIKRQRQFKELSQWEQQGRPCPPPHIVKQRILKTYAETYGLRTFVETGTYLGDMVHAMRDSFEKIYSIELSQDLFIAAKRRFVRDKNVEIIHGDSGIIIGNIVKKLERPSLFWLDGHYSAGVTVRGQKDSPIIEELSHILRGPDLNHVIVIDDARCFGSCSEYPSLATLRQYILSLRHNVDIVVQDDCIRVTPNR